MFTGIIESIGSIKRIIKQPKAIILEIEATKIISKIKIGDSVAVDGVCLTVTKLTDRTFFVTLMNETLKNTNFAKARIKHTLNLELAMAANGRFDGHIVSGHIDGTGIISNITNDGVAKLYTIKTSTDITKYIIYKGSITINGISLTVINVTEHEFSVGIIPHTAEVTNIGSQKIGDTVNLENDILAKYLEKFILNAQKKVV